MDVGEVPKHLGSRELHLLHLQLLLAQQTLHTLGFALVTLDSLSWFCFFRFDLFQCRFWFGLNRLGFVCIRFCNRLLQSCSFLWSRLCHRFCFNSFRIS